MDYQTMKVFAAVAECGSFSKAANQLYISPTAVMKQINLLEQLVGLKLLERTSRGVVLTHVGQSLYADVKYILQYMNDAVQRAHTVFQQERHTIRIGSSQMYPATNAIELWDAISKQYPLLSLSMVSFQEYDSMEHILNIGKKYDLLYVAFNALGNQAVNEAYSFLPVSSAHFCAAMSKKHSLAKRQALKLEDLDGQVLRIMELGVSPINDQIRMRVKQEYPQIKVKDISPHYHLDMFNRCMEGTDIMLSLDIWRDIHPGLVHIPLDIDETIPCGFMYSNAPNPETQLFLDAVRSLLKV